MVRRHQLSLAPPLAALSALTDSGAGAGGAAGASGLSATGAGAGAGAWSAGRGLDRRRRGPCVAGACVVVACVVDANVVDGGMLIVADGLVGEALATRIRRSSSTGSAGLVVGEDEAAESESDDDTSGHRGSPGQLLHVMSSSVGRRENGGVPGTRP
jgi:hypothetical protein